MRLEHSTSIVQFEATPQALALALLRLVPRMAALQQTQQENLF